MGFVLTPSTSLAVLAGREALHAEEELAERGGVGKMEAVGDLLDAEVGCAQQEGGLHHEHLVDIVDDGAACDLADDAREIDAGDVEPGGVEGDVVMFGEVLGQQAYEADEYLLDALRDLSVRNGFCLGIQQVEQEDGVEHLQNLRLVDVVGMKVSDNLVHLL